MSFVLTAADIKAIKASVRKWQRVATGTGPERGQRNCALCKLHFGEGAELGLVEACKACPVRLRTGKLFCEGTPFDDWKALQDTPHVQWNAGGDGYFAVSAAAKAVAQREAEFLKSLLLSGGAA